MRLSLWVAFLFLFFTSSSQAKDLCAEYANYTPLPDWYTELCNGAGKSLSKIGGAYSSFGDAFNLNPASIPTAKTPLGVEYIGSFQGTGFKNSFAFIKGFGHVGTALTTNSDDTFYGNNVFQVPGQSPLNLNGVPSTTSSTSTQLPTVNLGSALSLDSFFKNQKSLPFDFSSNLGVMAKYNKVSGGFTPGFGYGLEVWKFSLGVSFTQDPETALSPSVQYSTVTLGFKASFLQVEFVTITSRSTPQFISTTDASGNTTFTIDDRTTRPATMITLSSNIAGFLITGAARAYQDVLGVNHNQYHLAVEYIITPKVAIEYLNNYVIDHQSLGLQVLF